MTGCRRCPDGVGARAARALPLTGDEVVLDAGCGSGRVTAELIRRVPRGRVYGVDVAPSMAEHAREALVDRATILCQDLVELDLPEPVDVAFSNATFHWIHDHERLFGALHRALKPGGRLVAQCGGYGNIDAFRTTADAVAAEEPFAPHFADWRRPWNYAGAEDTDRRLRAAGFVDVSCWLEPKSRKSWGPSCVHSNGMSRSPSGPAPRAASRSVHRLRARTLRAAARARLRAPQHGGRALVLTGSLIAGTC